MIKIKNRNNLYFEGMDPWENALSTKKLSLLKKSWAEIFRQHILPHMPVRQVAAYFDKATGRPTKVRIPVKTAGYSGRSRPPIPEENGRSTSSDISV